VALSRRTSLDLIRSDAFHRQFRQRRGVGGRQIPRPIFVPSDVEPENIDAQIRRDVSSD
jgi:hypothetical protein